MSRRLHPLFSIALYTLHPPSAPTTRNALPWPHHPHQILQAVIAELEDLDQERSPEDLMLSYVSDKSSKDRTDRELVAPWFKFLWETYRNILDILRNNVKFTVMYGMVTKQAFQFCLQYKRNTEFRRLCEILRNQLLTLTKCALLLL
jgi:hypothetical protein